MTLIHHFLENSARRFPVKIALIHEDVRASYAQINSQANQLARWLRDHGISNGDRVVLILENCQEYAVSYYGSLKAGAVAVPLGTDLKPDGLGPIFKELEPKAIITSSRFAPLINALELPRTKLPTIVLKERRGKPASTFMSYTNYDDIVAGIERGNPEIQIEESALASIIYTSGSTGKPKGVMLSHRNVVSNVDSICRYLSITDNDIQMVVLPFFYVMGKSLLNTHFAAGASIVINNKFAYPASVIQQMIDEKVTAFSGVPSTYAYLLHRSPLEKYRDKLTSLRYCSQAGGHMADHLKKELRLILPSHTQIFIMYGATEAASRLTYLAPEKYAEKMGSIGKPIPDVALCVRDKKGREVSAGQTGELVASGPNIMQGYWQDSESTAAVLTQNGYHTGDLGYRDKDGYFYVFGRKDNLLKVGGHRINPREIEDALMATGLVIEAVVIGLPDELLGSKLIAVATAKTRDCLEDCILGSCSEKLPKYKLPASLKLVRSLPKNANGKINREKCMEFIDR